MYELRICPWCDHTNNITQGELNFCKNCCHRTDVPRESCDCLMCSAFPEITRPETATVGDLPPIPSETFLPELPYTAGYTTGIKLTRDGQRVGTAAMTASEVGLCLVAGDHGSPETKMMVEWEREQLVHIVCIMLPYLSHAELLRVVRECKIH